MPATKSPTKRTLSAIVRKVVKRKKKEVLEKEIKNKKQKPEKSGLSFAFVDVETTGGNAVFDRIIEIAVVIVENDSIVRSWSTLLNPERPIPSMITMLTGISQRDIDLAPTFAGISAELFELLQGKVFVAHNARFDYGFVKNEFKRQGIAYQAKTLCTVKLSRALYPRHKSHNLDSIIERHGIECPNRHRALDDIKVVTEFWALARRDRGEESFEWCVSAMLKQPSLPSALSAASLQAVPDGPGVYLFYGQREAPLYVGKSVDLHTRVLSHFSGDHQRRKDMEIAQRIRRIEHRRTVGELGALLMESKLIKKYQPLYNVQQRRSTLYCSLCIEEDKKKPHKVRIAEHPDIHPSKFDSLFGIFKNKHTAKDRLEELMEAYSLCPKVLGLEDAKKSGPCFAFHLKKCKGVCAEEEEALAHNVRLRMALSSMRLQAWPLEGPIGIKESEHLTDSSEIHVIDNWCHLSTVRDEHELRELLESPYGEPEFDIDIYKILSGFFRRRMQGKKPRQEYGVEILTLERKTRPAAALTID